MSAASHSAGSAYRQNSNDRHELKSPGVVITPGLADKTLKRPKSGTAGIAMPPPRSAHFEHRAGRIRALSAIAVMSLAFLAVGGQLVRLAMQGQTEQRIAVSAPIATAFARPDIVDRNGRLLANDIVMESLIADPSAVLDTEEVIHDLTTVFPDLNGEKIRGALSDRSKKFAWLRRGISDAEADQINNLGPPGVSFRSELRRAYPLGRTAGHVLGFVDIDNKGLTGIEAYLDNAKYVEPVHAPTLSTRAPLRLSLDVAVQFALEDELTKAITRYKAKAASGIIMEANTGAVVAAVSLPGIDPGVTDERLDNARLDRLTGGVFELGSVFKTMTLAMAFDSGTVSPNSIIDVTRPLEVDGYTIRDPHPARRPLTAAEVFLKSSNVGSGMLALAEGAERQKAFLDRLGLTSQISTETGSVSAPSLPSRWGDIETVTVSYGHGLAVSPLQFAAAGATLVNGGFKVTPTFLRDKPDGGHSPLEATRVVKPGTSRAIRQLMLANVASGHGTGGRAAVPGIAVGGKTGTAEIAGKDGYRKKAVISSFFAAFPMENPRYVTLISLFEPTGTPETAGGITAGLNAAPTTSKVISRIAPLLGIFPSSTQL